LYFSPNVYWGENIKEDEEDVACGTYGVEENAFRVLVKS
jgi:hypothetical protein